MRLIILLCALTSCRNTDVTITGCDKVRVHVKAGPGDNEQAVQVVIDGAPVLLVVPAPFGFPVSTKPVTAEKMP